MFDGMAVAIQKPPLSSDTNNWKLKKVIIVTASTVNTLKNQLLINNLSDSPQTHLIFLVY